MLNQKLVILPVALTFCLFANSSTPSEATDLTLKYSKQFDFSTLLKPKTEFLGYIEPKYQRLYIKFDSIQKSHSNASIYYINGSATKNQTTCHFSGELAVLKILKYPQMHYGVDDELKDTGMKAQGELIGNYELKPDRKEKSCGTFSGKMKLFWYVDKNSQIQYDDIESSYSDAFKNNQYQGFWRLSVGDQKRAANWGEYRIPDSGDLDTGAAQFSADPKYKSQGW